MATLIRSDLEFILTQIAIAEAHAAGEDLTDLVPDVFAPFGLRTVDGSYNNLVNTATGASDQTFPTLVPPSPPSPYDVPGNVTDPQPRIISNLVADMTSNNPAAVQAFVDGGFGSIRESDGALLDGDGNVIPPGTLLTIPNVAPDAGLSAPFNSWFTFFGQFFDHGLDLVNKSSTEFVMMPLQPDDPLYDPAHPETNFMVVARVTKDANGNPTNATTPFVDQNQTYTSHPSHQVFLREYVLDADGHPVATGQLLNGADGGLPTWADVKFQAEHVLGILLDDMDVLNLPMVVTDPYGRFIPDGNGMPQLVTSAGPPPVTASGNLASPTDATGAVRTNHAFLNDIAHSAAPVSDLGAILTPDDDDVINTGGSQPAGTYDDELLDRHFITGDGRGNENIALTSVHHVFHSEHNRQIEAIKATVLATEDPEFIASWQLDDGSWNGERLFQAARFATEMQYQHLVFEEFARKLHVGVDEFLAPEGYDINIDPAIVGEFAHAMFRVGHTMLTDSVDRLDPDFNSSDLSLLDAFLNPVAFNNDGALTADEAAGAIVRGMTRQVGNEIDEFVTDAVRNTLLGLPLDLAAINIARGRDTGVPTLNEARREFYEMMGNGLGAGASEVKPYTSWFDLAQNLKHQASVVNFIAAYGTHSALQAADVNTVEEKREVALALVFGGTATINAGTASERTFTANEADRLAFLHSTGSYANTPAGVTTTGVDDIDLWIGGLAEKQMPFGGMLGSTFAFIFENQLESLQNGDRFYYLSRTAGMHFAAELENNSFSGLVMLNTNATHLPGDIFSTPAWILEADQNKQFTGLGDDGRDDPTGGTALIPLVIRDNPATPGQDVGYLHYTGEDHVVLGGTSGRDTLIGSVGDDTLYGDEDNDRLEGGYGNDKLFGGDGDDILTDIGGDDVIRGGAGNDVIHGGAGGIVAPQILFGGTGNDFIVTGDDVSTTFAGEGNDFILGSKLNLPTLGNEGDDWIELGTQDGAGGDNFDPKGMGIIRGNDVFITGNGFDEAEGEGGDDIMVFSDGQDNFTGGGQFDWASYANDPSGVTADFFINAAAEVPATPSNQGILDRFAEVEGLSGSSHSDYLRGDSSVLAHLVAGFSGLDQTLTDVDLYAGLQAVLGAGVNSFTGGNIILGGDGSDLLEGRGDNDIIDGDRWLNVRISVRQNADGTGPEVGSYQSMVDLVPDMMAGKINPGQLQIVREILPGSGSFSFDTAMFSGNRSEYVITTAADGAVIVNHLNPLTPNLSDGIDMVRNVERLQFNDQAVVLSPGGNAGPTGALTLDDSTPQVNQVLHVSAAGIRDADNVSATNPTGTLTKPVAYFWQVESVAGSGVFQDIVTATLGNRESATGTSYTVTAAESGLAMRVRAVYQDEHGVLENVYSAPTGAVTGVQPVAPPPPAPPTESDVATPGIHLIRSDLQFILDQIMIGEANSDAYGHDAQPLRELLPNTRLPWGLRTVDGSYNNLVPGQEQFGAADENFPLLLDQIFRNDLDGDNFFGITNTNYATSGPGANVVDADPRIISNLIVDQTFHNPAATDANGGAASVMSPGLDGQFGTADDRPVYFIGNTTPDAGLSAPYNAWFTFFGQFFDHGLDLIDKGGNGAIFVPLEADDPLIAGADGVFNTGDDLPVAQRFMLLTRATNTAVQAGADGIFGTADDRHFHNNQTTPFVDQNQTYTSHASHQVFLREYVFDADGHTVATGKLIDGANGGIGNWAEVKEQARTYLGIILTDEDVLNVPLLATDLYGKFIPGPHGYAQVVTNNGLVEGTAAGLDIHHLPPVLGVPTTVGRTGHPFLADIAHNAAPVSGTGVLLTPDDDTTVGNAVDATHYDDELLDKHFITGDGRGNENIGLTTVHFIFHHEHNRLVDYIKQVVTASNDPAFIAQWKLDVGTPDEAWNGERLFQAARFATEMQYQHLVFEEFARRIQPNIDPFLPEGQNYESPINPAIVAEFADVVYRFGHSMLNETVDRFDPDFNLVNGDKQIGLIAAFLNPMEFTASGATDEDAAAAIIRGLARQPGNEIDEFVTEALRNNLLGLPLDLPAINMARARDAGVPSLNQARAEFFTMTGDTNLKPYSSWADFAGHLKHEASLVNFVAAYGTHSGLTAADVDTLAERRAVALALILGGTAVINQGTSSERIFTANNADRFAFLNSTGTYANTATGATTTGVDGIDLWIGGLAEKQTPFGGLLGSTFNFVFENQLENLQNADRFYYLDRTTNLNFRSELEGNSFARLIMANTGVKHLPGLVFDTPAYTLEVNKADQYTGLGADHRADPTKPGALVPLVIRDNPDTPVLDTHYLRYTGEDHVVLGGTSGNDTLIGSNGDDTLWGDEGNDRLDGGAGNDRIRGGAGDDIITNQFGDDDLQGGDGNDAIHGGSGVELVIGGHGNDFIVGGNDATEVIAGPGNDFVLAGKGNEFTFGNEGDDWIEHGMADGTSGDSFDHLSRDAITGNDVFMGDSVADRMFGEGGDDIMIGMGGQIDRYLGFSGFDWAVFKHPTQGAYADMNLRVSNTATILPGAVAATQTRFQTMEGMSGSAFTDVLIGDEADAGGIAAAGATGSVMTHIDLIDGMQEFLDQFFGPGTTSFGAGNIILGGDGSDLLEGRGGDDLIDGDSSLDAYISVRANIDGTGAEIRHANNMSELVDDIFAGRINPGQLVTTRTLVAGNGEYNYDTAVYRGNLDEYTITTDPVTGVVTVDHNGGIDGVDHLVNIERLQFADQVVVLDTPAADALPEGLLAISDTTPTAGHALTVSSAGVTDADNVSASNPTGAITRPVTYFWQVELAPGSGIFEDISVTTPAGDLMATGRKFTPTAAETGLLLRVRAVFQDANGVIETVYSEPTQAVANGAPTGALRISDATPTEGSVLRAVNAFVDPDGTTLSVFHYQWMQSAVGGGGTFTPIAGATSATFTPGQAQVNRQLQLVVTFTDDAGNNETLTSAPTTVTGDFIAANAAAQSLTGNAGADNVLGGGGNDTIQGLGGNDTLAGGTGNDSVDAGAGNDTVNYVVGDGVDNIDGGAGTDRLNYTGTAGANALSAIIAAGSISSLGGNTLTSVESIAVDLLGGADTLTYTGATQDVQVNLARGTATGFTSLLGVENVVTGSGNDVLAGKLGVTNNLSGGAGNDTYTVEDSTDVVIEGGNAGIDTVHARTFSYTLGNNIENIDYVGSGNFVGVGNGMANTMTGGRGADAMQGGGASDTLNGGFGADTLEGGAQNDSLEGGGGSDLLVGGGGNDTTNGGGGNDVFNYIIGEGVDSVNGGAGQDRFHVIGSNGANLLTAIVVAGQLTQVAGNAMVAVETASTDLQGGIDTITFAGTTEGVAVDLNAGTATGFSSLLGVENAVGGSGNDTLTGALGVANTLTGGAGNDTYIVNELGDTIVETNTGGTADEVRTSLASYTLSNNVESLVYIGTGTFTGTGSAGSNAITGGADNDTLSGANGNDTIDGAGGNDSIAGEAGDDSLLGGLGDDTVLGGLANDFIDGGAGNDSVVGGDSADILHGGDGDDVVTGNTGNDALFGDAGNDTLRGAQGSDTLSGGAGNDTINYILGDGLDVIDGGDDFDQLNITGSAGINLLSVIFAAGALTSVAGNTVTNVETAVADLLDGVDTLTYAGTTEDVSVDLGGGGSGFTSLVGIENLITGSGNDTLTSSVGTDNTLRGGLGNDTYEVHESGDVVVEAAGGGTADAVHSFAATFTLPNNVEILVFTGTGDFVGTGTAAANAITGGDGADTLSGGNGNDTIDGGNGNDAIDAGAADDRVIGGNGDDVMDGGLGNDVFVFQPGFGNDRIVAGFDANVAGGQDLLDISGLGITAATFGTVSITVADLDGGVGLLDTLVTIGSESITLFGVDGAGANAITQADFLLA